MKGVKLQPISHSSGTLVLGRAAHALSTRSLQHDSTQGKLKSERRETTANFAFLRDPLFWGTVRALYLLLLRNLKQKKGFVGTTTLQR